MRATLALLLCCTAAVAAQAAGGAAGGRALLACASTLGCQTSTIDPTAVPSTPVQLGLTFGLDPNSPEKMVLPFSAFSTPATSYEIAYGVCMVLGCNCARFART